MQGQQSSPPPASDAMDVDGAPTPQSDMDKIRLKRLAKLQQQQEQQLRDREAAKKYEAARSPPSIAQVRRAMPVARFIATDELLKQPPKPTPSPSPATATTPQPVAGPSKTPFKINIRPASKPATPVAAPIGPTETFEQWEDAAIGRILNVTLDVRALSDISSSQKALMRL